MDYIKIEEIDSEDYTFDLHNEFVLKREEEEDQPDLFYVTNDFMWRTEVKEECDIFDVKTEIIPKSEIKIENESPFDELLNSELLLKSEVDDNSQFYEVHMDEQQEESLFQHFDGKIEPSYTSSVKVEKKRPANCKVVKKKVFQCRYCVFNARQLSTLNSHINQMHNGEKAFQCKYCAFETKDINCFISHVDGNHRTEKKLRGAKPENFGEPRLGTSKIRSKVEIFQCPQCDYYSTDAGNMEKHINQTHVKEKRYQCKYCVFETTEFERFLRHVDVEHMRERTFRCDKCDYKTNVQDHFEGHVSSKHKGKIVQRSLKRRANSRRTKGDARGWDA